MDEIRNFEFDNIPVTWDDITLNKFIEIRKLYSKNDGKPNQIDLLALITEKDVEYVKSLPATFVIELVNAMQFLNTPITDKVSNKIVIDDITYQINFKEDLKFLEFVDCNTVIESDENNFAAILAILCRKENEVYDDNFIATELDNRIKMFGECSMTQIQPLIAFFLNCLMTSSQVMQLFSDNLKEQVNNILDNYMNLMRNGAGKKRCTILQMRKLKKLQKSLKYI